MRNVGVGSRSSLLSHTFPTFYACYLLKSVQFPSSKATYIGSTPDPPRRIRQHNGELTQGAYKTRYKRPWVMQMIVYGFPSKLAALQFEWAWQHPHLSRHLKDESGKSVFSSTGRYLKQNIHILRYMLTHHPYDTWPLHVKVFTSEAEKCWNELNHASKTVGVKRGATVVVRSLPPGFKWTLELEGVDGKSGKVGSGRKGPLEVKDEEFTSAYLRKNHAVVAADSSPNCAICGDILIRYAEQPLTHTLCPHDSCTAVTHLSCLSEEFLNQTFPSVTNNSRSIPMIPRGGKCPSCRNYILWGDVVKGMYRRVAEGAKVAEEQEFEVDEEAYGKMFESDSVLSGDEMDDAVDSPKKKTKRDKGKGKASASVKAGTKRRKSGSGRPSENSSSEGEVFDFAEVDDAEFSDDDLVFSKFQPPSSKKTPSKKGTGGKRKGGKTQVTPVVRPVPISTLAVTVPLFASSTSTETTPKKTGRKSRRQDRKESSSEGEVFDFGEVDNMSTSEDEALYTPSKKSIKSGLTTPSPRKRRPLKAPTGTTRHHYTLASAKKSSDIIMFYASDDDYAQSRTKATMEKAGSRRPVLPQNNALLESRPASGQHADAPMLESTDISDFSVEKGLVRTMSSLSVSSPSQVIIISD